VKDKSNFGKHLKIVALAVLSAAVLWRLWRGLSWAEMRQTFIQANGLLLMSVVGLSAVNNLLRAFRWRVLLAPSAAAGINDVFAATNIGIGGGFVFGNAVGEVIRPLALSLLSHQVRRTTAFLTIMVERLFDISVLCVLFGLSLLWFPIIGNKLGWSNYLTEAGVVLLVLPFVALAALMLLKRRFTTLSSQVGKDGLRPQTLSRANHSSQSERFRKVSRAASHLWQQLMRALSVLTNAQELIVVTLWTIAQWLSVIITNWLILRAFGLPFGFKETILMMSFGLVGSLVPTPGGAAGAFHAAVSGGLILLGVTVEKAAAISIAAHLAGFIPALVLGSYYLLRRGLNLAQLQREIAVIAETR